MLVRLRVKLAEMVNGVDLSHCNEGDVIDVSDQDGTMLIAEKWAERADAAEVTCEPKRVERAVAADKGVQQERIRAKSGWTEHRFYLSPSSNPEHEP
jgi:hypothetical protein